MLSRPIRRPLAALLVIAVPLYATGCLSNEYRIPQQELQRLASVDPARRGERVHVVQGIGSHRTPPPSPELAEGPAVLDGPAEVVVHADWSIPAGHPSHGVRPSGRFAGTTGVGRPPVSGGWRTGGAPATAPSPPRARPASGGGGGGGGCCGGIKSVPLPSGGKGEELAILAVVVAVVAAFAVLGLAASEGARFDGYTRMHPGQPVHLKQENGDELVVPLAGLAPEHLAMTSEAVVYEDEAYGLRLMDRRPLDRVGATFKFTVGPMFEPPAQDPTQPWEGGLASTIQIGGFFTQSVGLVGSLSLSGGTDGQGRTLQRHGLGAELQYFPLRAGPFSLGLAGHGGAQLYGDSERGFSYGPALGGGVLMELALSTRMALALRGDWTASRPGHLDGWVSGGAVTMGLAIY